MFCEASRSKKKGRGAHLWCTQAKWQIIAQPARFQTVEKMELIMRAWILLHNVMIEERVKLDEELDTFYSLSVDKVGGDYSIGRTKNPMRVSLVRNESISVALPNTLTVVLDNQDCPIDEVECLRTRYLLIRIFGNGRGMSKSTGK